MFMRLGEATQTHHDLMGANAIVMMRFESSKIGQTISEIVAYATAVVIAPAEA
jgi:uncharacterized protein YbjQ (UPF0145 family)